MSLEETRAELVTAFNAAIPEKVARCFPRYRQTVRPGDAWVRFAVRNRADNGFGYVDRWEMWLVLPQKLDDAEKWLDEHLDTLLDALAPLFVGGVETVTPAELALGTNAVNGVIFQGAREG
jgi:hypothetical protein